MNETATSRYGKSFDGHLSHPADKMPEPEHVVMTTKRKGKRERFYPTGAAGSKENAALCGIALTTLPTGAVPDRDTRIGLVKLTMDAVKPKNELEAMLAMQLIAANAASMEAFGRAMTETRIPVYEAYLNQANKASRTFATLLEALDRHRGKGGQQKVRVEHVHVYEGGQAIVGAIGPGGAGGSKRIGRQSHAQPALTNARQPALRGEDPEWMHMPVSSDEERAVPNARGQSRRTKG